ncbi:hypothetical protein HY933_01650 [Candidatus Falkowbacteria bacterium]|nr:hypothetical protein [Candidatus Falkowbacteria bacterium]
MNGQQTIQAAEHFARLQARVKLARAQQAQERRKRLRAQLKCLKSVFPYYAAAIVIVAILYAVKGDAALAIKLAILFIALAVSVIGWLTIRMLKKQAAAPPRLARVSERYAPSADAEARGRDAVTKHDRAPAAKPGSPPPISMLRKSDRGSHA